MQRLQQVVERMGSGEVLPSVSARDIEWFVDKLSALGPPG